MVNGHGHGQLKEPYHLSGSSGSQHEVKYKAESVVVESKQNGSKKS